MEHCIGNRFGRLTVVSVNEIKNHRHTMYNCVCECGEETVVQRGNLKSGKSKSCGCLRAELLITNNSKPDTAFQDLFRSYKKGARVRGLTWELTEDQFRALTKSPCYFTGRPPSKKVFSRRARYGRGVLLGGEYIYNGIDRLDNTKGYTVENSVPCCEEANFAKNRMTHDNFINMCREVAEHHKV